MRLTIEQLQQKRQKSAKLRAKANIWYGKSTNGGKPRAEAETKALARVTYNRVKRAVENGSIDMSRFKTERRLIFNVLRN